MSLILSELAVFIFGLFFAFRNINFRKATLSVVVTKLIIVIILSHLIFCLALGVYYFWGYNPDDEMWYLPLVSVPVMYFLQTLRHLIYLFTFIFFVVFIIYLYKNKS